MDEAKLHILLVEDNPGDADLVQEALAQVDHQPAITHVERMEQALHCLKQGRPVDCVLLDLALPDSNGLATLQRAHCAAAYLPIIVLTGLEDEALGIEAVRNGAQDYLVKGQTPPRMLMRAIRYAIDRTQAREALRKSEEQLRLALSAGGLATWDRRLPGGEAIWNDEHFRMMGYEPGEVQPGYQAWAQRVHPEDRSAVEAEFRRCLEQGTNYMAEFRALWPNGQVRWIEARGQVERDAEGQPIRCYGVMLDISERKQAEGLRGKLAAIVESSDDAILSKDLNGVIQTWNAGAQRLFGYRAEEIVGRPITLLVPPERIQEEQQILASVRSGQRVEHLDTVRVSKDGTCLDVSLTVSPVKDRNGQIIGASKIIRDITEHKRAEDALRRSQERLALAASGTRIGMFDRNLATGEALWTEQLSRLLGIATTTTTTTTTTTLSLAYHYRDWAERVHPEDLPRVESELRRCMGEHAPLEAEYRVVWPDGSVHWLATRAVFQYDAEDRPQRMLGIVMDITERKQFEEALREREERLTLHFENTPLAVIEWGPDFRLLRWSAEAERIFGWRAAEVVGKRMDEFRWIYDEDVGHVAQVSAGLRDGSCPRSVSHNRNYRKDGSVVSCEWYNSSLLDESGKLRSILSLVLDVTERKRAEEELRQANERLRLLLNALPVGVTIAEDPQCRFISTNPAGTRMFEVPEGSNVSASAPQPPPHRYFHQGKELRPEEMPMQIAVLGNREVPDTEIEAYLPSGRRWIGLTSATPLRDREGIVIGGIAVTRDITERKLAEDALRESEERFRTMADGLPLMIWVHDAEGSLRFVNRTYCEFFGVSLDRVCGPNWQPLVHPDDATAYVGEFFSCVRDRRPFHAEARVRGGNGQWRWIESWGRPRFSASGEFLGIVGTSPDITDRKRAEEAMLEAKAAAEAASELKSQFLANMSHELRTPMNAILGMMNVALPKATDPIVQDCLQTARGSADLLLTLLNDLLDSAKIESGKLELESAAFSLRRMLDQLTRVLAVRASEKGLSFYCRVPNETPDAVVGDRMRLQQVLLNLAGNAVKFTERGEVEMSVHTLSHDGGACLEFAVRDTGIGIPPSRLEHIFQPFTQADASMSRRFGGTGLGLSISKSLVEMMGGTIRVESDLGKGSVFYFTVRLPSAKELPADFEAPVALPTATCGQLRVLLVEDNPANQKLATYILRDRGHLVEIAGDGLEAICLTEQNRYDVILMDVQMPGMNGLEATAAIRKRENSGSRVPIVAMTAHAMKGDRDRCLAAGMDGYLSKPVNALEMIGLVESLAGGAVPVAQPASAAPCPEERSPQATALVFNPDEALTRCFNSQGMVREMIECFYAEVDKLFPEMRAALEKGDLMEVGRLGHRMKGTVVYLGAQTAKEAALRVERFCKCGGGTPSEAEDAINALEHECVALKAALAGHPLAADLARGE